MQIINESYSEIFNARAESYHQAMQRYPNARDQEFNSAIQLANLKAGQWLADIPSGGGYLSAYLPDHCKLLQVEASEVFAQLNPKQTMGRSIIALPHTLPFHAKQLDRVISIAGLHHCQNKPDIFRELYRVINNGGCLVLADVEDKSSEALFLDEFVHAHNSMGHQGEYLNSATLNDLQEAGFEIEDNQLKPLRWHFQNEHDMARFCKDLFGMDKAELSLVKKGIQSYQGYDVDEGGVLMKWKLRYIKCVKS